MDKYVLEIRELEGDEVVNTTKPDSKRNIEKLEKAYDRKIDHSKYYSIVVKE